MSRILLLLPCLFLLVGCATSDYLADQVRPYEVKDDASKPVIFLEEELTYTVTRGFGAEWTEGLKAGIYTAELENQFGTFFQGPADCVIQRMGDVPMGPFDGGIWISKDPAIKSPKIYYYFGYDKGNKTNNSLLINPFLEAKKGEITFMIDVDSPTFLDDISVRDGDAKAIRSAAGSKVKGVSTLN